MGIIIGLAILVGGVILVINLFSSGDSQKPVVSSPPPSTSQGNIPAPKPSPSPIAVTPTPGPTQTSPSAAPAPTLKAGIWEFSITGVSGGGLTRTITVQITNTSASDANNVQAKIEVFSGQQRIKMSGQDDITENLGTVKSKTTVTRQETVTLSLTDGMKVMQNGARFVLTMTSDKGTDTLTYDYKP